MKPLFKMFLLLFTVAGGLDITAAYANISESGHIANGHIKYELLYPGPGLTLNLIGTDVSCNALCDGEVIAIVTGNGPFTYQWSDGSKKQSIENICAGIYSVTVSDKQGNFIKASINIDEPDPITGDVHATNATLYRECNGSIEITNLQGGVAPYSFLWSTGETTSDALGLCQGLFTVGITDARDCTSQLNIEVKWY